MDCELCAANPATHYRVPTTYGVRCVCRECYARHARVLHQPVTTPRRRETPALVALPVSEQLYFPFVTQ